LVQLEVRTGAEGTSTTGSCFGAAGSCDPDDRFFFGSSPGAAAMADDPGLTTNTAALFAVAWGRSQASSTPYLARVPVWPRRACSRARSGGGGTCSRGHKMFDEIKRQ